VEVAQAPAETTFTPDPLNTLKYSPLIVEALSKVFDPEIPVNIYELGLVYDIHVDSAANVSIRMTLTAPACPAAQTIPLDVERNVREVSGINDVKVAVVWDPPWTRDRMSEMAKLTLGML
jgi:FeS assembly SUF system protein